MKKIYLTFISILSFIGISSVKADSIKNMYIYNSMSYPEFYNFYTDLTHDFYDIYSYYEENYINIYPYFIYVPGNFLLFSTLPVLEELYPNRYFYTAPYLLSYDNNINSYALEYYNGSKEVIDNDIIFPDFFSNFNFAFPYNYNSYAIGYKSSTGIDNQARQILINSTDGIPTIYEYLELNFIDETVVNNYQEINLNNYSYVALSLKNYNLSTAFSTNVYIKGQLCFQPIYNYGMVEKDTLTDRCSVVYNSFTPVRTYILKQDLENHAIYYLKSRDISIENKVKVDTNIFDITYITQENEDNPSVIINGRSYPTIPWNDLTSTVIDNENNNYIPGISCAIGDLNCTNQFSNTSWTDIFNSPLQALKDVWSAITSIFSLITAFILLLPPVMQNFLYVAFTIGIILGIIKIIL